MKQNSNWKESLKRMSKEKLILEMILFAMILSLIGVSYALYTYRIEKEQVFTIIAGDLAYTLTCNRLDKERKITLAPGQVEVLEIKVGSLNEFETAYKIYYMGGNDGVKVSYYQNEVYQGEGTLNKEEQDEIQVILENNSQEEVRLQFGIEGGFVGKDLALREGKELVQFQGDIVLAYRYEGGGTPPSSFPKKEDGYQVKEVECRNATGVWDSDNWEAKISSITGSGAICTVVFTKEYRDGSGANPPKLVDGMIPVTYNGTNWVKADTSSEWYDYDNQEWANVVTVVENGTNTREYYQNAPVETVIPMEDINTMWVWIPRYEYMYTNLGDQYAGGTQDQPGEIRINFITKDVTSPSSGEYKVHPAFNFGGTELSGIWVGKFETSISEKCTAGDGDINKGCDLTGFTLQIKPNVTSWRGARVSTFFRSIREMQTSKYATYGFVNDDSYDIHMSKNSEWGAIAYLSQSKYGKYGSISYVGVDKEVAVNNCDEYITGIGGDAVSASQSSITCTTNTYETTKGQSASTTGNVTGIYDMSGGGWEYMMDVLADSKGLPRSGSSELQNSGFNGMLSDGSNYNSGLSFPEVKYYSTYMLNPMIVCNGNVCYGYALDETSGWYYDDNLIPSIHFPWFVRGGLFEDTTDTGVFCFSGTHGFANEDSASRVVLAPIT